ncbi:hypothetical protein AOLI_G00026620 [Acnodon oligacanthus]
MQVNINNAQKDARLKLEDRTISPKYGFIRISTDLKEYDLRSWAHQADRTAIILTDHQPQAAPTFTHHRRGSVCACAKPDCGTGNKRAALP